MKNAIILHGTGGTPQSFWFPNIKQYLESKGYQVWVPQLPDADTPDIKKQLPYVLNHGIFNEETITIGHSSGCPLLLSILENLSCKISKAILVSGFGRKIRNSAEPILQEQYNWEKIKKMTTKFYFINSDNDPWGCNDKEGAYLQKKLGGELIINRGEGHMGSDKFKQPYREFPLLKTILDR